MRLAEIKEKARKMGLTRERMRKGELIREIQGKEGNLPCFGTSQVETCGEGGCLWKADCLKVYKRLR